MSELIGGFLEISKGSVHAGWSWAGAVMQFGKIFWFFPPDFNETWKSLTLIIFLIFSVCQRYIKSHSLSWSPCRTLGPAFGQLTQSIAWLNCLKKGVNFEKKLSLHMFPLTQSMMKLLPGLRTQTGLPAQMVMSERDGGFTSSINWQRLHRIWGAGGDKSHQNRMKAKVGGPRRRLFLQTGVRAGRRAANWQYNCSELFESLMTYWYPDSLEVSVAAVTGLSENWLHCNALSNIFSPEIYLKMQQAWKKVDKL